MNEDAYMTLAHISGEIWGTLARAHMHAATPSRATGEPPIPEVGKRVLGYDIYFEIFGKLKDDFKKEVPSGGDETKTPDGEDT